MMQEQELGLPCHPKQLENRPKYTKQLLSSNEKQVWQNVIHERREINIMGVGRGLIVLVFRLESYSRPWSKERESQEEHTNLAELSIWSLVSRDTARSCMAKFQKGGSWGANELQKSA